MAENIKSFLFIGIGIGFVLGIIFSLIVYFWNKKKGEIKPLDQKQVIHYELAYETKKELESEADKCEKCTYWRYEHSNNSTDNSDLYCSKHDIKFDKLLKRKKQAMRQK